MFTDILLAASPSEVSHWAAETAVALARRHQAKLTIFHVCGPPVYQWSEMSFLAPSGEIGQVKSKMQEYFQAQVGDLPGCTVEVVPGLPKEEILRIARKKNVDLIVMGSREKLQTERRPSTWGLTGSTLEGVSQRAPCPVMIISRPVDRERLHFNTLVMATDFSPEARCALGYSSQLARQYHARLVVIHALDVGSQYERLRVYQEDIEALAEETKKRMEQEYGQVLKGVDHTFEAWEGPPYVEILKVARRVGADLILMAHHSKEKDPEKAYLGSTVAQVAIRSACPTVSINKHFDLRCAWY